MRRFEILRAGVFVVLLFCALRVWAKEHQPSGKIAVSSGDSVVLADPVTGLAETVDTGPVAWLFPAPGGVLFAPDLVHGRTTVINLRNGRVQDVLDGVTMPHFGDRTDRYLVVGHEVMVMSYPERALIKKYELSVDHPWQVAILAYNTVMIVLERKPDGSGGSALTALNLGGGDVVYRRPMDGDVRHIAFSPELAVMALADATAKRVILADPGTLTPAADFEISGTPADVAFADGGAILVVAYTTSDDRGGLLMLKMKAGKNGLEVKKKWTVELSGRPVRMMSSPDQQFVAVALESAVVQVVNVATRSPVTTVELPSAPRDLAWCDPSSPGPLLPEWSDTEAPHLDFGGIR
jgi:hypothetical protein